MTNTTARRIGVGAMGLIGVLFYGFRFLEWLEERATKIPIHGPKR